MLTVQPRSHSNEDDRHTPVPQEWAESWGVAISDLLEGQLVRDWIFNDQDVRLLKNFPYTGPVAVQQVLERQGKNGSYEQGEIRESIPTVNLTLHNPSPAKNKYLTVASS